MNPDASRLTPAQALAACRNITANVSTAPNVFDLSAEALQRLASVDDGLALAVEAQRLSAAEFRSKVTAKDAALDDARRAVAAAIRTALASGATTAELAGIGMARPAKPVRPLSIPAPTDLVAKAVSATSAKLVWDRGGAAYGATFQVFVAPDGLDWRMVETTTKASIVLADQPAGQAAWYRVRAARSGLLSSFSNEASLYAAGAAAVRLRVA